MAGAVVAGLLLAISPALSAPAEKLSPVDQAGYQKLLASNKGSVLVVARQQFLRFKRFWKVIVGP
jgi:hypothetical protein